MNIFNLVMEYNNSIKEMKKKNRKDFKPPRYRTGAAIISILLILGCFITYIFCSVYLDPKGQLIAYLIIAGFIILSTIFILKVVEEKDKKISSGDKSYKEKCEEYKRKEIVLLKEFLRSYNIDFRDCNQIMLLIDEVDKEKERRTSLNDLKKYFVAPLLVFIVPMILASWSNLTKDISLEDQLYIIAQIACIVEGVAMTIFVFEGPIKEFFGRKYDKMTADLKTMMLFYG